MRGGLDQNRQALLYDKDVCITFALLDPLTLVNDVNGLLIKSLYIVLRVD